jgi:hypothetical protein
MYLPRFSGRPKATRDTAPWLRDENLSIDQESWHRCKRLSTVA